MVQMNRIMGKPLRDTKKISYLVIVDRIEIQVLSRCESASRSYLGHSRRIGGWQHEGVPYTKIGGDCDILEAIDFAWCSVRAGTGRISRQCDERESFGK